MSRKVNKLENNSHKRATIINYTSTPKKEKVMLRHYSISLSEINTASSSSGDRKKLQLQMQDLTRKHKKFTKEKKIEGRWRMKDSDSDCEAKRKQLIDENKKRKKKLKREEIAKKKRILKDTDSEWETKSEKSINEFSINSQNSMNNNECIKLFENLGTPEKTRDMPNTYEENLYTHESPIIGSSRKRSHLITKQNMPNTYEENLYTLESPFIGSFRKRSHLITRNDIVPQDKLLPENLSLTEVRNLEETDENEMICDYESNAQIHVPLQKPEQSSKQEYENYNLPIQFPTNNLHRDQFAKTYSGMKSQKSTSVSPVKITVFMPKLHNVHRNQENSPIPPGMTCVNEYWNEALQKWIRYTENSSENEPKTGKHKAKPSKRNTKKSRQKQKYDAYVATDETDTEFETGGQSGERMSFREFCRKRKGVSCVSNKFIRL